MKHRGNHNTYTRQLSTDLRYAYRRLIAEAPHIYLPHIFQQLVLQPTPRFYVSEERALIVVQRMLRGLPITHMRPMRQQMYHEIYCRTIQHLIDHPSCSLTDAVWHVVNSSAPRFYLTPQSAKVIIYRSRGKR